jgi:hypothetical protein
MQILRIFEVMKESKLAIPAIFPRSSAELHHWLALLWCCLFSALDVMS